MSEEPISSEPDAAEDEQPAVGNAKSGRAAAFGLALLYASVEEGISAIIDALLSHL